jgi:hypothetical protein
MIKIRCMQLWKIGYQIFDVDPTSCTYSQAAVSIPTTASRSVNTSAWTHISYDVWSITSTRSVESIEIVSRIETFVQCVVQCVIQCGSLSGERAG